MTPHQISELLNEDINFNNGLLFEERIISKKSGYLSPVYIIQIDTIVPKDEIEDEELLDKVNIVDQF